MVKNSLTQARLKELLEYDLLTGVWRRRVSRGNTKTGDEAGTVQKGGYKRIEVDGTKYLVNRLAFLFVTGAWPRVEVDHQDGNPSNNAWANLRDVTRPQNQQNLHAARANNRLGILGVTEYLSRFRATIRANGVVHYLGLFDTKELASQAYLAKKREMHECGEIARDARQSPIKRSRSSTSVSGLTGVTFYKRKNKWIASFRSNRKSHYLGIFDTPELAHAAYIEAKRKLHPLGML
jgi:hypothetical protein